MRGAVAYRGAIAAVAARAAGCAAGRAYSKNSPAARKARFCRLLSIGCGND